MGCGISAPEAGTTEALSLGGKKLVQLDDASEKENGFLTQSRAIVFTLRELTAATDDFNKPQDIGGDREDRLLGKGSFGSVYKAYLQMREELRTFQEQGREREQFLTVAVKRLDSSSKKKNGYEEWLQEIIILGTYAHPALVQLIGYCSQGSESLLVYEYCHYRSIDTLLFKENPPILLTWGQRVRIALDCAQGLAFLHQNNIIHRDFKAANVVITRDIRGKLTDFGMVRQGPENGATHVSTRIMGTKGYIDPQYWTTGRITAKTDVYAFGVFLLVLMSAKPSVNGDGDTIVEEHDSFLRNNNADVGFFLDPRLKGRFSREGAKRLKHLAKYCIRLKPSDRPTMTEAEAYLDHILEKYC